MKKQVFSYQKQQKDELCECFPKPSQEAIQESKAIIERLKMELKKTPAEKLGRKVLRCSVGQ